MIVLIDNYDSFTHNLYQYLSELTTEKVWVVRNDRVTLEELAAAGPSRIVISPGPGRPAEAGVSIPAIKRFAREVPILGVCLGHQAIGEAFGGRIVGAKRIVHGKAERIKVDGRGVFRAINSPAEFVRYHSLAVAADSVPEELEVTAWSEDGEIMGLRHREYPVEGVQFHPESVASEDGKKLLANFLNYRREPFEPKHYLQVVIDKTDLNLQEASEFMEELTDGNLTDAQIAGFLVALNAKGIRADEIAGCAAVLQRKRIPLPVEGALLDTCGTGGDGLGTFNISSLTALVAASCGAKVAKHGNRAVSSRSGSADFYRALGINIDITPDRAAESIGETGFAFLFAPLYHGAMRFAGPARRQLGIKTIMNLLGPLVNPARAEYQLIGVFSEVFMRPMAEAAVTLGIRKGMVVHGLDGQDEISVCAPTRIIAFERRDTAAAPEGTNQSTAPATGDGSRTAATYDIATAVFDDFVIQPQNYDLRLHPQESLVGGNAEENAEIALRLLAGETGIDRDGEIVHPVLAALHDAVVLNAGAALSIYGTVETIHEGVAAARR
ncbi:MAG: bifunctional anthranilate synthase component II/anthranilate phosphoribosyltransferase, partial [Alkalispirochaeta sp.]